MDNLVSPHEAPRVGVLLTGPLKLAHRVRVTLAGGQGVLPRGAVLYRDGANDGLCKQAGSTQLTGTVPLLYILEEAVDTGTGAGLPAKVGAAFDAGHFNRAALKFAGATTLTDAIEAVLRGQGMHLDYVQA